MLISSTPDIMLTTKIYTKTLLNIITVSPQPAPPRLNTRYFQGKLISHLMLLCEITPKVINKSGLSSLNGNSGVVK